MNKAVYSAIAMALYESDGYDMHDEESGVLTIKPRKSEWSSNGQKMTQLP